MKRFLVFTGGDYYPGRAWEDFRGDFDTEEEAHAHITRKGYGGELTWRQVVDTERRQVTTYSDGDAEKRSFEDFMGGGR